MDLREIGEFGLINRIRNWKAFYDPTLIQGIGDDVAVMEMGKKVLLATTDILIEGVHFHRSWIDPYRLGRKALMVNLSDIAAMGGIPRYFLISLGLPNNLPFRYVSWFFRGIMEAAKRFKVALAGGDTSFSQKVLVNICLLGEAKKNLIFRRGAKIGDDLFVSGTLGDSALGLKILQREGPRGRPRKPVERHLSPSPRLQLGQALAEDRLSTAMIDVSDGLLIDTTHLLEESKAGAVIWQNRIPLSRAYRKYAPFYSKDPHQMALSGGEDYELLFTALPRMRERILSLALSLKIPITRIGQIRRRQEGLRLIGEDGKEYCPAVLGFDHFRKRQSGENGRG